MVTAHQCSSISLYCLCISNDPKKSTATTNKTNKTTLNKDETNEKETDNAQPVTPAWTCECKWTNRKGNRVCGGGSQLHGCGISYVNHLSEDKVDSSVKNFKLEDKKKEKMLTFKQFLEKNKVAKHYAAQNYAQKKLSQDEEETKQKSVNQRPRSAWTCGCKWTNRKGNTVCGGGSPHHGCGVAYGNHVSGDSIKREERKEQKKRILQKYREEGTEEGTAMSFTQFFKKNQTNKMYSQQKREYHTSNTFGTSNDSVDANPIVIGLDYGSLSVRATYVDASNGRVLGNGVSEYKHGFITKELPLNTTSKTIELPSHVVLQSSSDWWNSTKEALMLAQEELPNNIRSQDVVGIGSCFTACTPLPVSKHATPLHTMEKYVDVSLHAWPKLWKYQATNGAYDLTKGMQDQEWLQDRYGGKVGAEWMHSKCLDMYDEAPDVFQDT